MGAFAGRTRLDRYRETVASLSRLEPVEEAELATRWRDGDRTAGRKLIEANLRLVIAIAHEYRRWGVPMDDVIQQGSIGLLKAAERFDPTRDNRLRSYAAYWIRAEIRDYVVRSYRIVRLGTTRTERRAMRAFRARQVETVEELVALSGMPEARCRQLWPLLAQNDSSLDAPAATGTWEALRSERDETPEQHTILEQERAQQQAVVAEALAGLSDREQRIVRARLMSDSPPTLEALSKKMGVSRERVRQLEKRAKEKLEDALAPLVA